MPSLRKLSVCSLLLMMTGCRPHYTPPEAPMPPNTILLSAMMRELSAQPGFTEALLAELDKGGKKGPALLTPKLIDNLRQRILGKDWSGLDRFPGWTMKEISPTVRTVGHLAGESEQLEDASAVHPGASPSSAQAHQYLDLGNFALDQPFSIVLNDPGLLKAPFSTEGAVTSLGAGVVRGDGPNDIAQEHGNSQLLAETLNRLAANRLNGAKQFSATTSPYPTSPDSSRIAPMIPKSDHPSVTTPQDLIVQLQQTGHTVTVTDSRYFANFGHFHYKGLDVMMPFWVNSQIIIPNTNRRPLLVPVAHAEYEWHIRAPQGRPGINADVSYYYGVDGKSQWRTMDTQDQPWVLKRNAHTYTGADAVEVTRLAGQLTVAYMHLHAAHPTIPFGGYYAFGVCQDGVSAIEKKMTGKATLFPNTADMSFFNDPRDAEVNALIAAIPKDRAGRMPEPERIFGSLPAGPGPAPGPDNDFSAITIPGLAQDLAAVHYAWTEGLLQRTDHRLLKWIVYGALLIGGIFAINAVRRRNVHEV